MSVEAPERIWVDVKAMTASSVAGRAPFFGVGYVRIDKLEELELHVRHADAYLQSAQGAIQRAEQAEAALAEAKRENEALHSLVRQAKGWVADHAWQWHEKADQTLTRNAGRNDAE